MISAGAGDKSHPRAQRVQERHVGLYELAPPERVGRTTSSNDTLTAVPFSNQDRARSSTNLAGRSPGRRGPT